ncbi:MAG: adenylate/guanylate cyclase domain-containing protein [Verrucomicrobia bacterium]|nr:adenylate/guanylate cyclase domain-containing protein [Verrucomicrobiota bacterium]
MCAGFALLFGSLQHWGLEGVTEMEFFAEDLILRQGRLAPVDSRLVFVAIDQPSYVSFFSEEEMRKDPALRMASKNWPWSREVWSIAIERLVAAGARVVALDLVFAAEGPGDDALRATVERHADRVVLGADIVVSEQDSGSSTNVLIPPSSVLRTQARHPLLDPRLGVITQEPDMPGSVIRRARFRSGDELRALIGPDAHAESLAARMLRQGGLAERIPAGEELMRFRFLSPPGNGVSRVPLLQILHTPSWEAAFGRTGFFKDKWVIIGPAAPIFHDEHRSPFGENMLGPEVHLNILNAASGGEFIRSTSVLGSWLLTLGAGLVAWTLSWRAPKLMQRFALAALCLAAYGLAAWMLYSVHGAGSRFIPIFAPAFTLGSATMFTLVWDFSLARREKARLRRTLERYVGKDVVRELIDNPDSYLNSLVGVRKPVAILFSDVRGFTSMTEEANARLLVKQLNEYFQEMVDKVVVNRGRLDKFIGDAVMADWGSFVSGGTSIDCERAVVSALQMRAALPALNARWSSEGLKPLAIGIGVNLGEVIVGNLGSDENMNVTVIGDAVNTASRLESLTKQYQVDLLLGESIAEQVRDRFTLRSVDCVKVAGKSRPVEVFTIPPEAGDAKVRFDWLDAHERGVRLYRERRFVEAMAAFREALSMRPDDALLQLYIDRCAHLLAHPPDASWSGVFEMTKK